MEHPLLDGQAGDDEPDASGAANTPPLVEGATGTPESSRGAALKRRQRTMYDLKVGPPGSRTSEEAVAQIRRAVREAIGYAPPDINDPTLHGVLAQRVRSIFATMPDDVRPPQYSIRSPRDGEKSAEKAPAHPSTALDERGDFRVGTGTTIEAPQRKDPSGGSILDGDDMKGATEPKPIHADMLFSVIPRRWYQKIRVERGRGATRSKRVYFEAIHILAYVVFMYRDLHRFQGELLHMNQKSICKMLGITSDDYLKAIRYLEREGYITRVVIRGLVPWDPRSVGVYTFAIPRIAKLRGVTLHGKRAEPGDKITKSILVSVRAKRCPYCRRLNWPD